MSKFKLSRNQKRVRNRNRDLERSVNSPWATEEQYDLFKHYLGSRHATGGMADMDVFEFAAWLKKPPSKPA